MNPFDTFIDNLLIESKVNTLPEKLASGIRKELEESLQEKLLLIIYSKLSLEDKNIYDSFLLSEKATEANAFAHEKISNLDELFVK